MNIYIGADHHGFKDKTKLIDYLKSQGYEVIDEGDVSLNPEDDFPVFAAKVVQHILSDNSDSRGILLCGSGQGMCMAANRFKGIRASMCWDEKEAYSARHDDDSNILCLSADNTDWEYMKRIIEAWLTTPFAPEERFIRRIKELDNLG
ncbi:MAG: RpiB/LacA/LacB family sugar-phosphate isomerase [Candidatus Saccharibacteria bacterium]